VADTDASITAADPALVTPIVEIALRVAADRQGGPGPALRWSDEEAAVMGGSAGC
jgi:hypothetical protein